MKKYIIVGIADNCPLCITPVDGRTKSVPVPIFQVTCEGGFSGDICAAHVYALIKADEPKKPEVKPTIPMASAK